MKEKPSWLRSSVSRIRQLLVRWSRGRSLGLTFRGARTFRVPPSILVKGKAQPIEIPADNGSKTAFVEILLDDCYGLHRLPKTITSVLDIGAHVGLFSLAARIRFPDAEIHAYEPNPLMHPFLERQSRTGGFMVFPEALGLEEGSVSIATQTESVQTKVVSDPGSPIKCRAFRDAIGRMKGPAIAVKMDCEGGEWEILQDSAAWAPVRYLMMEYHLWSGYTLPALRDRLQSLGFKIQSATRDTAPFGVIFAQKNDA